VDSPQQAEDGGVGSLPITANPRLGGY
jgi:hypothetical protein